MIHKARGYVLPIVIILTILFGALTAQVSPAFIYPTGILGALLLLGVYDLAQRKHSLLRNYPILGHLRFLLEDAGPELHQYFVESNTDGAPFDRDQRALMYQRAKSVPDEKPFGTELDVYREGHSWLMQSLHPAPMTEKPAESLRTVVGEGRCEKPYSASVLNISAMSFGALGMNAIRAMNKGARMGGFAHCTGEGGFSRYHKENGGDIIFQVGTGYFGCRNDDGTFNTEMFAEQAKDDQIKLIEIKLSQGAKPGHGGVLPGSKVTKEISEARRVPQGRDCLSPPGHSAFSTPRELLEFVTKLRELSGGKPIGFKLCVGNPREVFALGKAMVETDLLPDFITVDGAEGGTGAAPIEFADHLGMPLREGLILVQNMLVGFGLRDRLKIAASGKRISGFEIASAMSMGADWCNSARGFMLSVGCIQSQLCHTNQCPVGVATQDHKLQRAINVDNKAERVRNFHANTVHALAEVTAAAGLAHPQEFGPEHYWWRLAANDVRPLNQIYDFWEPGQLLDGGPGEQLASSFEAAHPDRW